MRLIGWISIGLLATFLAACGDDETTPAPQDVSDILALDGNATTGQGLFSTCAAGSSCHGTTGDDGNGGKLSERVPALDDEQLATVIRYGIDTADIPSSMPPQGEQAGGPLTAQEIADVMAYLRENFQ